MTSVKDELEERIVKVNEEYNIVLDKNKVKDLATKILLDACSNIIIIIHFQSCLRWCIHNILVRQYFP